MVLQIQADDLIGYWPLDDLPEGSGINNLTFIDRSGNGNDGTGKDGDADSNAVAEVILTYAGISPYVNFVVAAPAAGAPQVIIFSMINWLLSKVV